MREPTRCQTRFYARQRHGFLAFFDTFLRTDTYVSCSRPARRIPRRPFSYVYPRNYHTCYTPSVYTYYYNSSTFIITYAITVLPPHNRPAWKLSNHCPLYDTKVHVSSGTIRELSYRRRNRSSNSGRFRIEFNSIIIRWAHVYEIIRCFACTTAVREIDKYNLERTAAVIDCTNSPHTPYDV